MIPSRKPGKFSTSVVFISAPPGGHRPLEDQRLQAGPRGVDGCGVAGRAGADDDDVAGLTHGPLLLLDWSVRLQPIVGEEDSRAGRAGRVEESGRWHDDRAQRGAGAALEHLRLLAVAGRRPQGQHGRDARRSRRGRAARGRRPRATRSRRRTGRRTMPAHRGRRPGSRPSRTPRPAGDSTSRRRFWEVEPQRLGLGSRLGYASRRPRPPRCWVRPRPPRVVGRTGPARRSAPLLSVCVVRTARRR